MKKNNEANFKNLTTFLKQTISKVLKIAFNKKILEKFTKKSLQNENDRACIWLE